MTKLSARGLPRSRLAALSFALVAALLVTPGLAHSKPAGHWWHPGPLSSWQYDLDWPVAVPTRLGPVQAYDIDWDGSGQGTEGQVRELVARIRSEGGHAICYVDVGAWENYRPDASEYSPKLLGASMDGYPDERYVDIRQWADDPGPGGATLSRILAARFERCKSEGFSGVETDIDDSYTDNTGFPLTLGDEVTFDTRVANLLHSLGLAWFLKNGINGDSFITDMEPLADGTVNEQCWQYQECSALVPFVKAHKPVLNVEYVPEDEASICRQALAFPMATMDTDVNLEGDLNWACWAQSH
ncbi:MAG TPA: endo alpha-1,4 polygalactosaminidase [Acidimicrobiales bacterium]|nr:endo alpha-1,4 polygalactosaminidase [Acidimicrobiales bacterium]